MESRGEFGHHDKGPGRLEALMLNSQKGLFGALFMIQKKWQHSTFLSVAGSVIRLAQMLSFCFKKTFTGWREGSLLSAQTFAGAPTVTFWFFAMDDNSYFVLFYFALLWVIAFISLTAYVSYCSYREYFPALFPVYRLREIGALSGTVIFIPLLTLLLSTWQCDDPIQSRFWASAGYTCYSDAHLGLAVFSGVLSVALVVLSSLFALVYYDSAPMSSNVVAQAHGRVDFIFLILKIVLVLTIDIFSPRIPSVVLVGIVNACAVAWVLSSLYFLPYYSAHWNAWNTAQGSMFLYAAVCLAISEGYHETDAAVMLYLGVGLAGAAGARLALMRMTAIARTPSALLSSPYEVEIKTRLVLHKALWGHETDRLFSVSHRAGMNTRAEEADEALIGGNGIDESEEDVTNRLASFAKLIPNATLQEVQAIYKAASVRFRNSAILHVFFSRFYLLTGNSYLMVSHIQQADRRHPTFDVAFEVYKARKDARERANKSEGGESLSAVLRVEFEKHSVDSRRLVQFAASRQVAFWAELTEPLPDLSKLHKLSTELGDVIDKAEMSFKKLLELEPDSLGTLRLYAAFNEYTLANVEMSKVLIQHAERIEDQGTRDHRVASVGKDKPLVIMSESSVPFSTESTATLTVRGTGRNVGQIVYCNAAAVKLFGYSRLQMERRDFFSLLPEPLSGLWEAMVREYTQTGEGNLSQTHVAFGLKRESVVVPILLRMTDTAADAGPPGFIVQARELSRPNESYVVLTTGNCITAASSSALRDFVLSPAALQSKEVNVEDFIAEWSAPLVQAELRSPSGSTLCIDSKGARLLAGVGSELASDMPPDADGEGGSGPVLGRTFVRATLHAVSLVPPKAGLGGFKSAGAKAPSGGPTSGRVIKRRRSLGSVLSFTPGHGGAPEEGGPGSVWETADPTSYCLVLSYSHIAASDTYSLAKAAKKPAETMAVVSPKSSLQVPASARSGTAAPRAITSPALGATYKSDPVTEEMSDSASSGSGSGSGSDDDGSVSPQPKGGKVAWTEPDLSDPREAGLDGSAPRRQVSEDRTPRSGVKFQSSGPPRSGGKPAGRAYSESGRTHDTSSMVSATTAGRRALTKLRRVLGSHSRMGAGMLALRGAGAFVGVLSIALALIAAVVMDAQFSAYSDNLVYTHLGNARVQNFFASVVHVQNLVMQSRGWLPSSAAAFAAEKAGLAATAAIFISAHREMYTMALRAPDLTALYKDAKTTPVTLTVYDTPAAAATNYGSFVTYNLFQAGMELGGLFVDIAKLPMNNFTDDNYAPLLEVWTNCLPGGIAHETIHATSLETGYLKSVSSRVQSALIAEWVYVTISGVLGLVALTVFAPILLMIEGSKDSIVKSFVYLPMLVKKTICEESEKRAAALRRDFANDEDDDDEDDDDTERDPLDEVPADRRQATAGDVVIEESTRDRDEAETDWDSVIARVRASSARAPRGRAFQKGCRSTALLFAKFMGPLIALFLFFSAIYLVETTVLQNTLSLASTQVAASYRAACNKESLMDLTRTVMVHSDRQFFLVSLSASADTVDCIAYHQELLMYGKPPGESRGEYVSTTPVSETGSFGLLSASVNLRIWNAQMSSACPLLMSSGGRHPSTTLASCEAWSGGILKQGVGAVIRAVVHKTRDLLDRRMRVRIVENTLGGYIIPVPSYPYANDTCGAPGTPPGTDCYSYPAGAADQLSATSPGPLTDVHGDVDVHWDAAAWNAEPWSMKEEVQSADFAWLREADTYYLTPLLAELQELYNAAAMAGVASFRFFLRYAVGVFVVCFILYMTVVFLPQVHALHSELQKKRAMLLFVPPQVLLTYPSTRSLVDQILAEDLTTIARSSRGSARNDGEERGGAGSARKRERAEVASEQKTTPARGGEGGPSSSLRRYPSRRKSVTEAVSTLGAGVALGEALLGM